MIRYGTNIHNGLRFEKVPSSTETSFVLDSPRGETLDCDYHYHPEMELTYIVSGSGRVLFGTEWTTFAPGEFALIGGNVPHCYVSLPEPGAIAEVRVIKFNCAFPDNGLFCLPELREVRELFAEAKTAVLFSADLSMGELFDDIRDKSGAERLLLVCSLLCRAVEIPRRILTADGAPPPLKSREREPLERAIRFLQLHFNEKITLSDVAAAVHMEQESFRRLFRRRVRMNFSGYLLELRMAMACKLLREGSLPIWEVAAASGFQNLSNFNRLFLARHQQTPRQYRAAFSR